MGNSRAYPVFQSTDAATAYEQAKHLRTLMAKCEAKAALYAELRTVEDVRQMVAVLPEADFDYFDYLDMRTGPAGEHVWFDLDVATVGAAALEAHLPLDVSADVPTGTVEERFVAVLGQGIADICWRGLWPERLEAEQYASANHDGVQIVFHGERAQLNGWTEHHTVFVHGCSNHGALTRAQELAALIGSKVLGEPQLGW
ncbi:hypothetical protein [Streptomyces sp. NBC_00503]|uniref:hypothetical protein n=1 Tax=Streptomyces sp. NBC_00503 TaxID=2903659 RepID=UPI002E80B970|nr:hypothetical protein [Streptomyces sp. NBC_00503]WUD85358.1 hypothetical protein OG490_34995 [Streptomyces sp. NBC_00503]